MPDYRFERLTTLDQSFLIFESHDTPMHVAAVQIYDVGPFRAPGGGVDAERLRQYIESRLHLIPRYRQRVAWTPIARRGIWVDDPHFNVFYHVRHTRLPPPGDERMLKRVAARILSQQLDLGKPLWELWVIEGLEGNRFAVVSKTHHCMIDGVSGVDLMSILMTTEPLEDIPPSPAWIFRPAPRRAELLWDEASQHLTAPLRLARGIWDLAQDEGQFRQDLMQGVRAAGRIVQAGLRNASNTPLNQPIGPYRRCDWLPMSLADIRAVRSQLGGTVNDIVLAVVTGAVQRFLRGSRHMNVTDLDFRVLAPVSLRGGEQRGTLGNRVSAWIMKLPMDEPDPRRRLERILKETEALKKAKAALGFEVVNQVTEWTGTTLISLASRLAAYGRPYNMVVTNVPGPRVPLYLLGSRMLEAHPMVPLFTNQALGIALFSYAGALSWGVTAEWSLFPDLHDFVTALQESFGELREAAEKEAAAHSIPPPAEKKPPTRSRRTRRRGEHDHGVARLLPETRH